MYELFRIGSKVLVNVCPGIDAVDYVEIVGFTFTGNLVVISLTDNDVYEIRPNFVI